MHVYSERHTVDPSTGRVVELLTAEQHDEIHSIRSERAAERGVVNFDPDQAYERHLENQGWEEALLTERMEADRGVVSFADAYAESDHIMAALAAARVLRCRRT